ncbi:MAG: hypothetical protein GY930_07915 [bacterium]|nr:hypothetical protein [bacterium]
MKTPITLALLCASLFACQATEQVETQGAISNSTDFLPMTVEAVTSIDTNTPIKPFILTSPIAEDGPNGLLPCIHIEASCKPIKVVHNPGDGCCGPLVAPNPPGKRDSAGPGSQTPPYTGAGN